MRAAGRLEAVLPSVEGYDLAENDVLPLDLEHLFRLAQLEEVAQPLVGPCVTRLYFA